MLHSTEGGLNDSLISLLQGLKQAVEVDFVILRLRSLPDERLSRSLYKIGSEPPINEMELTGIYTQVLDGQNMQTPPEAVPSWRALPLKLPDDQVLGVLLAGSNHPQAFHPRQEAILQTVSAQAALLVENERLFRSLEYKVVIQERTRLAREIHDGLAQTLAFLKLQAAQMQSYLEKGDLTRLSKVLKENYQVLADAYLDTRQSIDNLRLTPVAGLETWLEQAAVDFEANNSGLQVDRQVPALSAAWVNALSPEIQAQLIRIVQEALNNIRKHAHAKQVCIYMREWQDELVIEIQDDGQGFDADEVPELSQHGLRGMRERADMIGADFQIISKAFQGTTVRLVLPAFLKEATQ